MKLKRLFEANSVQYIQEVVAHFIYTFTITFYMVWVTTSWTDSIYMGQWHQCRICIEDKYLPTHSYICIIYTMHSCTFNRLVAHS